MNITYMMKSYIMTLPVHVYNLHEDKLFNDILIRLRVYKGFLFVGSSTQWRLLA